MIQPILSGRFGPQGELAGAPQKRGLHPLGARGVCLGLVLFHLASSWVLAGTQANSLTYLDSNDPFYPKLGFPKLTTPQWIGEPGVQAVVILAVDDMSQSGKYETFLRPILDRLKQIDGHAPLSIMTKSVPVADEQVQKWLKEGVTLEVHTIKHPCPCLANGDFDAGAQTYFECIDLLNQIVGNKPVAFRMPCCDSMNSPSPRFYNEIFSSLSPGGNFLTIDSSVMNLITPDDPDLPRELTAGPGGGARFHKYFPNQTNAVTKISLGNFATTIENYPYPYVIGRLCWEFPCAVPSDWEAFNCHGPTNSLTVADWKAALDATVIKQGVFTMVFHPHNWIRNDQIVEFIDYAVARHGSRLKFLSWREAQERINANLLAGQALRAADGGDNGVRLIDLNHDGYLDVIIGNEAMRKTRIWNPAAGQWTETDFPQSLTSPGPNDRRRDEGFRFGMVRTNELVTAFFRNDAAKGAWTFDGSRWVEEPEFFSALNVKGQPVATIEQGRDRGVRLRDVNQDGRCELIVGNESQNAIFAWSEEHHGWQRLPFALPAGTSLVNAAGEDNGLRFVDLNGDGYDDIVFSNESGYSVHMFIANARPHLGWEVGWTYKMRSGKPGAPGAIPMIARGGAHRNNGAWFHGQQLFVQNEDTAALPDQVARLSFKDLQLGEEPPAKSPADSLAGFKLAEGFKIELVASEPMIVDPVAFDWGADGKLWVVEMRDYPLGMDGKGKPGGTIRILEDTHGDGHYDKSTLYLENLRFPNGLLPWRKGILVSSAPDIFYAESAADGKVIQKVLFTGFGEGNQQHRINGFEYGLDNWLYAANGGSGGMVRSVLRDQKFDLRGHDVRLRPDEDLLELQPGTSQYGRHRDDWGNWFGNHNSSWGWHFFLPDRYLARNPHLAVSSNKKELAAYPDPNRVFAISHLQQRFNWPNLGLQVTAACSPTPYRDEIFGPAFASSLFTCEPAYNVIHREVLEQDGVSFASHRAATETNSEFLASTDIWFRPVMAKTGPDGALYVADMYRLIIEHPEYFPEELKHRPDLREGADKGRLYRIYPAGASLRKVPRLDGFKTSELVAALDSPNGWQRDTVQRLLVHSQDKGARQGLQNLLERSGNPKARLQALSTLDGLHSVTTKTLLAALKDQHFAVRRRAIELSEPQFGSSPELDSRLLALVDDLDLRVRYQLAFSLGEWKGPRIGTALARLALKDWSEEPMRTAVLSSSAHHLESVLGTVLAEAAQRDVPGNLVERFVRLSAEMGQDRALASALEQISRPAGSRYAGWQMAGLIGLLDGLSSRQLSLAAFENQCAPDLQKRVVGLEPLFAQARQEALDSSASEAERLQAVRLLGREVKGEAEDIAKLGELLSPRNSSALQQAALSGLQRASSIGAAEVLLKAWRAAGLGLRQQILNALFSRTAWTEVLMTALEEKKLTPGEVGTLQQQKLLNNSTAAVRDRAVKLFATINADREKIVESYKIVADLKGDRAHGHILFTQNCSVCHRLQGEGHSIGPDLGTVVDKPAQELVVAILDPNQAVDPAYTGYTAVTKDDRELSGILAAETPNSITLRMAGGAEELISRGELKEFTSSGRSLMPEGFEAGLKPQDLADLIAYVLNPPP